MTVRIVCVPIDLESRLPVAQLMKVISPAKQARLLRYRRPADQLRGLAAELTVRYVLETVYGMQRHAIRFGTGAKGKPYLELEDQVQQLEGQQLEDQVQQLEGQQLVQPLVQPLSFNVSHAGEWVAAAFAAQPIGIDVEEKRPVELEAIATRYFSAAEQRYLAQFLRPEEQLAAFYRIWTGKEAYLKATGEGLGGGLAQFTVDPDKGQIVLAGQSAPIHSTLAAAVSASEAPPAALSATPPAAADDVWQVRSYTIDPAYALSACARHACWPEQPQQLALDEIAAYFA